MPCSSSRIAPRTWLCALICCCLSGAVIAAPRLICEVTHAGKARTFSFAAVSDPYTVEAVNIDDRFRFKAVMVGNDQGIDYIKLYTYDLSSDLAVLLHEAKYLAPAPQRGAVADALTGMQYVYSLRRGREMTYHCALSEALQ